MPILSVVPVPPPPGWELLRADLRAEYVAQLVAAGVTVDWPTN